MGRNKKRHDVRKNVVKEVTVPNPQPVIQQFDQINPEIIRLQKELKDLSLQKEILEGDRHTLRTQQILQLSLTNQRKHNFIGYTLKLCQIQDGNPEAKLFEKVQVQTLLNLLESRDSDVQLQATKVIANLAAEERNHKTIVKENGISFLIILLRTDCPGDIHRIAAGAIANLAVTHDCHDEIIGKGGINVLSSLVYSARDIKTLVMVAKAIANLCGNSNLQKNPEVIDILFQIVKKESKPIVLEEVARGIANFARETTQTKNQPRLLVSNNLDWILENVENENSTIRLHLEIALCSLAPLKHRNRQKIMQKVQIIAQQSSNEDLRTFAENTLKNSDD